MAGLFAKMWHPSSEPLTLKKLEGIQLTMQTMVDCGTVNTGR